MEEWKEYKLGDCVEAVIDNRGKSAPTKPLGEFPLLEINSIGGYYPNYSVIRKYVDKVTYNTWFRSGHPICGDILIPTVGTIGIISIMDNHKACIAQNLIALRTKKEISNIFIYYFLKSPIVKKQLINLDIGGVQPSIKVPHLLNLSISLPEKDIQHKIASILSSLDDKIEVNRKINENLEQQAQALFKSWFVDFEPFKNGEFIESELGMIPKGWRVEPLANIMNFQEGPGIRNWQYVQNGGTKFINIRCIKDGDIYTETANMISNQEANGKYAHFMLQSGDIVMSCSGTLGRYAIVREDHLPLCLNTSVIRFIPISNFDYSFVLGTLTSSYFLNKQIEMACGSVQANFGPTHLKQMKILVPPEAIRTQYNEKCYPIIHLIQKQKYESRRLAELRDTLLPKLMSGELKVDEINL